ncbi:MAG: adenosylcobinamide-GDP ribazoletransferase [Vallitalea sp.]|jgi:adenosylcobinamide-GDP ribazoletransferase|nr:adenosylcobinamide-GDP ribazoletransferase [Vallitalea sp.]
MKGFILMLTFLTRIPIKYSFTFNSKDFVSGIKYMPLIGLIIGGCLFPIGLLDGKIQPSISSLLIIIIYLMITGGLHLDGLADVSDGLLSCRDRDKIFHIMKDSRIGTFGVISLILYFINMFVLIIYNGIFVILLFPVVGRCFALLVCAVSKYAKESGMGKDFIEGTNYIHVIFGFGLLTGLIILLNKPILLVAIIVTGIIIGIVTYRINKKLGGITGDVIGMTIELSQVIYLLSAYLVYALI